MDHNSEEVSKGLFVRVCVEVDINKPLKRKIKYVREGILYECLLDCETISNILLDVVVSLIDLILVSSILKVVLLRWKNYRRFSKLMTLMD